MRRMSKFGLGTLAAASFATGALTLTGTAVASAAPRPPAVPAACRASAHSHAYPSRPATFAAAGAGSVTIAPVNRGTLKVAAVHPAKGWRASIDSSSGSSVDVYFRSGTHTGKLEAEINDAGGLTVTVTSC